MVVSTRRVVHIVLLIVLGITLFPSFTNATRLPSSQRVLPLSIPQEVCSPPNTFPSQVYLPLIIANPAPIVTVGLEQNSYQHNESTSRLTLRIVRSSSSGYSSITVQTRDQSALAGQDYTPINQRLRFDPGQTIKTLAITITDDLAVEGTEQFLVALSNPSNAQLPLRSPVPVTVVDDDTAWALTSAINVGSASSSRAYQWAVNVDADDDAVNTPMGSPQQIGYTVNVERQELGSTLYTIYGTIAATNTGNASVDVSAVTLQLQYQLGTTQWLTATDDLRVEVPWFTIPVGESRSTPFTTTFAFDTSDGAAPPSLSALRVLSLLNGIDPSGIESGPWTATKSIVLPLPAPTTRFSSVTVSQSGVVSPTGGMQISGGAGGAQVVSTTPLVQHVVYLATRTAAPAAKLQHNVTLQELGLTVTADTQLQDNGPTDLPTLELRDVEPVDAYANVATPFTITLRVRPGVGLNPTNINLVELDLNGNVLRTLAPFVDDGLHADGLPNDGMYGARGTTTWNSIGSKRLAARAGLLTNTTLTSEAPPFQVMTKLPDAAWDIYDCVLRGADAQWDRAIASQPLAQAQVTTLQWVQTRIGVTQAFITPDKDVVVRFASGLEGVINVRDPNSFALSGSSAITTPPITQSTQLIVLEPPPAERIFPSSNQAIILNSIPTMVPSDNPGYRSIQRYLSASGYAVTLRYSTLADLATYKTLDRYGVVWTLGHGNWVPVSGVNMYTFSTGEIATKAKDKEYDRDIQAGRIATLKRDGRVIYFTRKSFYDTYYAGKKFPNTLWVVVNCSSLRQQDFAAMLHSKGVKSFVGFNDLVSAAQGMTRVERLFYGLSLGQMTLSEAMSRVPERTFTWVPYDDGVQVTTSFKTSDASAQTLLLRGGGFFNGNFEQGSLSGWGSRPSRGYANVFRVPAAYEFLAGRYAARLGPATYPPASGVGTTVPGIDRIFQTMLVPNNATTLSFDHVMSSYLPANGAFVLKVYQANSDVLLDSKVIKRYPGFGEQRPNFWYSPELHYRYDVRRFAGQNVRFVFENQQNNTNDQAVYLDNVVLK